MTRSTTWSELTCVVWKTNPTEAAEKSASAAIFALVIHAVWSNKLWILHQVIHGEFMCKIISYMKNVCFSLKQSWTPLFCVWSRVWSSHIGGLYMFLPKISTWLYCIPSSYWRIYSQFNFFHNLPHPHRPRHIMSAVTVFCSETRSWGLWTNSVSKLIAFVVCCCLFVHYVHSFFWNNLWLVKTMYPKEKQMTVQPANTTNVLKDLASGWRWPS